MLDEGKLEDKEIFCLLLNFPGKFRRQKRTSLRQHRGKTSAHASTLSVIVLRI